MPGSSEHIEVVNTMKWINKIAGQSASKWHRLSAGKRYSIMAIAVHALVGMIWLSYQPTLFETPFSTIIEDRNGRLMGVTLADDEQWRFPPKDDIPERFMHAITMYEDQRFFEHVGVDPMAIVRAVQSNMASGRIVSGASTLTMQVIRLSRKGRPRTLFEKAIEAALALRLELHATKEDILSLYTAHAPFGGNVVGLESASWRYFGRGPDRLSWAETAMLAVLPNQPALIHPGRNRGRLLAKRNDLLDKMHRAGVIDSLTCRLSKMESLPPEPRPFPNHAPHLLARMHKSDRGKRIITALQQSLQVKAARVVDRHQNVLSRNGIRNAAAVIMEVNTGRVVAYVGNGSADAPGRHVDLITARRSTGSILKPMLYAGMLQYGEMLPESLVPDVPLRIGGFAPQNYDKSFSGALTASQALARSLNVPAVHMLHTFGVDRFYTLLKQAGMTTLHRPASDYGLSLIIGGAEGTLEEITGMYAGLGRRINLFGEDSGDENISPQLIYEGLPNASSGKSPFIAGAAWLTLNALLEVSRPGIDSAWRQFSSSQKIAWKTGTSQGFRDAWAVGVTPDFAVGVWAGNADGEGRPGLVGGLVAAPILFELFDILDTGDNWFERPEADLREVEICARSGNRAGPYCDSRRTAFIPEAGLDTGGCANCLLIHCDQTGRFRVHSDCYRIADMTPKSWFVLPPAQAWYYKPRHAEYKPLPPFQPTCRAGEWIEEPLSLLYPTDDSLLYVPSELDGGRGRIVFVAAHSQPSSTIFWHLDDRYLGATSTMHQMALAPSPGEHVLTLVDEKGAALMRTFTVADKE